jgi:hypothetical protein
MSGVQGYYVFSTLETCGHCKADVNGCTSAAGGRMPEAALSDEAIFMLFPFYFK